MLAVDAGVEDALAAGLPATVVALADQVHMLMQTTIVSSCNKTITCLPKYPELLSFFIYVGAQLAAMDKSELKACIDTVMAAQECHPWPQSKHSCASTGVMHVVSDIAGAGPRRVGHG